MSQLESLARLHQKDLSLVVKSNLLLVTLYIVLFYRFFNSRLSDSDQAGCPEIQFSRQQIHSQ